jgi:hypothetical protein
MDKAAWKIIVALQVKRKKEGGIERVSLGSAGWSGR